MINFLISFTLQFYHTFLSHYRRLCSVLSVLFYFPMLLSLRRIMFLFMIWLIQELSQKHFSLLLTIILLFLSYNNIFHFYVIIPVNILLYIIVNFWLLKYFPSYNDNKMIISYTHHYTVFLLQYLYQENCSAIKLTL